MVKAFGLGTKESSSKLGTNIYIFILLLFFYFIFRHKNKSITFYPPNKKISSSKFKFRRGKKIPNYHEKGGDSYRG